MFNDRPHDPRLSESENRRLGELERQLRTSDPELEEALRTGRRRPGSLDPVQAALVGIIATPVILIASFLGGPVIGVIAVALALVVLFARVLLTKRSSSSGPSAYR